MPPSGLCTMCHSHGSADGMDLCNGKKGRRAQQAWCAPANVAANLLYFRVWLVIWATEQMRFGSGKAARSVDSILVLKCLAGVRTTE